MGRPRLLTPLAWLLSLEAWARLAFAATGLGGSAARASRLTGGAFGAPF